jgi:hypothetical protein
MYMIFFLVFPLVEIVNMFTVYILILCVKCLVVDIMLSLFLKFIFILCNASLVSSVVHFYLI